MEERMEVKDLDILPDLSQIKMALPDELPPPVQRDKFPAELLRSSTIENLISQNEELMTRLKVTLRRLAALETDNQKLVSEAQTEQLRAATATEQLLVLREKDSIWRLKTDDLEKDRSLLQEKLETLQNLYSLSQTQVDRHQKYHEKIKTQVKPFVQELKKYSKGLESKVKTLESEITKKEAEISDLRNQVVEITKSSQFQQQLLEKKNWQLTEHYEMLIHRLSKENEELKASNAELTQKNDRYKSVQEHSDQMENENIEMRRRIEKLVEKHKLEIEGAEEQIILRSREFSKLAVEHQDVVQKVLEEIEGKKKLEKQVFELRHQLDSLRFMWKTKTDENDRLKQAMEALEKLNVDLSAKLQEVRTDGSDSGV
jgi:chromosome segregation ATPase